MKHQIRFEQLWKFIFNTIYMVSSQRIRSIRRRIALRVRHPNGELRMLEGSFYGYGVVYLVFTCILYVQLIHIHLFMCR